MPNVMIWDMSIDRGFTTLAAFTRSRGAYVWPLPTGPFGGNSHSYLYRHKHTCTPTDTAVNQHRSSDQYGCINRHTSSNRYGQRDRNRHPSHSYRNPNSVRPLL